MIVTITTPLLCENYFNTCYNYIEFGTVASELSKLPRVSLIVQDNTVEHYQILKSDVFVLWIRFETISEFIPLYHEISEKYPDAKIILYGSPVTMRPDLFRQYCDYGVIGNRWAEGVRECVRKLINGEKQDIYVNYTGEYEDFFPDVSILPVYAYFGAYKNESNRITGYRNTNELALELAFGCNNHCPFCVVPKSRGGCEKWKDVDAAISYVQRCLKLYPFDFISVFASNFTDPNGEGAEFCGKVTQTGLPWKCVSNVATANYDILQLMGKSGCVRVGFGVETLNYDAQKKIRKFISQDTITLTAENCRKNHILPLAFCMLGIPGETKESFDDSLRFFKKIKMPVRVTAYTPYQMLNTAHSIEDLYLYSRIDHQFYTINGMTSDEFQLAVNDVNEYEIPAFAHKKNIKISYRQVSVNERRLRCYYFSGRYCAYTIYRGVSKRYSH